MRFLYITVIIITFMEVEWLGNDKNLWIFVVPSSKAETVMTKGNNLALGHIIAGKVCHLDILLGKMDFFKPMFCNSVREFTSNNISVASPEYFLILIKLLFKVRRLAVYRIKEYRYVLVNISFLFVCFYTLYTLRHNV